MVYKRFRKERLILRDYLAVDRTILSNEVTLLSYVRTSLTLFVGGVSLMQFFDSIYVVIIGALFIPLGFISFALGIRRYRAMIRGLADLKKLPPREPVQGD